MEIFQSYDHKCTATFLWFTVYIGHVYKRTYHKKTSKQIDRPINKHYS